MNSKSSSCVAPESWEIVSISSSSGSSLTSSTGSCLISGNDSMRGSISLPIPKSSSSSFCLFLAASSSRSRFLFLDVTGNSLALRFKASRSESAAWSTTSLVFTNVFSSSSSSSSSLTSAHAGRSLRRFFLGVRRSFSSSEMKESMLIRLNGRLSCSSVSLVRDVLLSSSDSSSSWN